MIRYPDFGPFFSFLKTTQVDAARDSVQEELNIEGSTTENSSASGGNWKNHFVFSVT